MRVIRLVKLTRLFKSFNFSSLDNYIIKVIHQNFKGTVFYLILPNFLLMIFTVHMLSCWWLFIGVEDDLNENWLVLNKFSDKPNLD